MEKFAVSESGVVVPVFISVKVGECKFQPPFSCGKTAIVDSDITRGVEPAAIEEKGRDRFHFYSVRCG